MIARNFGKGTIYSYTQNILYTDLRLSLLILPCSLVQKEGMKTNREQSCQVHPLFTIIIILKIGGPMGCTMKGGPLPCLRCQLQVKAGMRP
jgi:hypothetical protein